MSTYYTNSLILSAKKNGYQTITYNHVCVPNGFVTECKVSKQIDKEAFTGLGYSSNIVDSTEKASSIVFNQITRSIKIQNVINLGTNATTKKSNVLTIGKLHIRTTIQDIVKLCSEYGDVESCRINHNGIARVEMKTLKSAELVMKNFNGRQLDGKILDVRYKSFSEDSTKSKNVSALDSPPRRNYKSFSEDSTRSKNVSALDRSLSPPRRNYKSKKSATKNQKEKLDKDLDEYFGKIKCSEEDNDLLRSR